MEQLSEDFQFLSEDCLARNSVDQLAEAAENLHKKYTSDFDASEFISETESIKFQADSMMNNLKEAIPLEILQFIHRGALTDAYPNIKITIRMFLAIPVTVA